MITEDNIKACINAIRNVDRYPSQHNSVNRLTKQRSDRAIRILIREGYQDIVFEELL